MPLTYMLDTNICIYITKQKPINVLKRFELLSVGEVAMSIITYGELVYGAQRSHSSDKVMAHLQELISIIPPLPMPTDAAEQYGAIRADLTGKGNIIGNNDLWIASHALSLDVTLVTNNVKEFRPVPNLKLENWY